MITVKILPLDVYDVSSQNKYEIIKYLLSTTPHSRNAVAQAKNLSSVTVGKIASAMLKRNILVGERGPSLRGRSTELLCASPLLSILHLRFNENSFSASFITLDSIERLITKRQKNDSFEYADDLQIFITTLQRKLLSFSNVDIVGVFVTYVDKHPKSRGVDVGKLLKIEPDIIINEEEAIGIAFGHRKDCDIALHLNIDYRVIARLFVHGKNISQNALGYKVAEGNEYDIALELSKYLANLLKTIIPDTISIDSENITADKRFFELVAKNVSRITKLPINELPMAIDQRNISLTAESALIVITELYAKRLADIAN